MFIIKKKKILVFGFPEILFFFFSREAAETRRAERRSSRSGEDGLFFLAGPSFQHQ